MTDEHPIDYINQKLTAAVDQLVSGPSPIKTRMWNAFMMFHPLTERDFPPDILAQFKSIKAYLTDAKPIGDEGLVTAAIRAMSDDECARVARKVLALYLRVREKMGPDD